MIGLLKEYRTAVIAIAAAVVISVLVAAGTMAGNRIYEAGGAAVRLEWARDRADALMKADADRRLAQMRIDRAETRYLEGRTGDALRIAALEESLLAKDTLNADPAASCPARPSVRRRVSNALDAIGR